MGTTLFRHLALNTFDEAKLTFEVWPAAAWLSRFLAPIGHWHIEWTWIVPERLAR